MSSECTIQNVFNRFYPAYESVHPVSGIQRKAAYHIMNCKTGAFGVNVSVCEDCGYIQIHYNSCRDRCCPMCQEFPKEKWVDARREDLLDAPYFHVVFTVPEELNPVIYSNQKLLYNALYHASSATLSELAADPKYLGADIGYVFILHTWGSAMNFHPHIHAIVLGGGLDPSSHWKDKGEDFFLPIKVISRLFRGKYLSELKALWQGGRLEFHGNAKSYQNHYAFKELLDTCYGKEWVPYCKKPFHGAESVIRYLGKYTHRIAISNHRIKNMTDSTVTFSVKDYKNQGQWKEVTISGEEFIRRFLMHVPPKRFVRIRHYGLLSSRVKNKKVTLCRNLLGCKKYLSRLKSLDASAIIKLLYGKDICTCNSCGGRIVPLTAQQSSETVRPHLRC
ncbi:MAG: IS91 family transposase [Lachnospiraceae bacterium]|nr:IS91 family transposase [Lachnospiraceae bacterium]